MCSYVCTHTANMTAGRLLTEALLPVSFLFWLFAGAIFFFSSCFFYYRKVWAWEGSQ